MSTPRTAVLAAVALVVLGVAAPAVAHPFGPPPTALVSARGHSVFVEWRSAADDAVAIGVEVGLLPEDLVDVYLEGPAQAAPSEARELALSGSDELRDYLLEHIVVHQDGERCRATVQPIGNFVHEGARVVHECPEPVDVVDLTITMLHDRHPAYRTFAISGGEDVDPQQAVFSVDNPRHPWDFTAEQGPAAAGGGGDGGLGWLPLAGVGFLTVVMVVAVVGLVVRGGRK